MLKKPFMASLEKPRKLRKPLGKCGNCRKETLEKPSENAGKGLKKRYEMEDRQSIEKTRNIEANILEKIRIQSSTESSSVGVRSKTVCKGMKSDTEEGVAKGCKAWTSVKKRNMQASCVIERERETHTQIDIYILYIYR